MEVLVEGLKQIMLIICLISGTVTAVSFAIMVVMFMIQLWEEFRR